MSWTCARAPSCRRGRRATRDADVVAVAHGELRRRVVDFLEALLQQRPFLPQLPRVGVEAAEFVDKHLVFPAHFGGAHCLFNPHLSC